MPKLLVILPISMFIVVFSRPHQTRAAPSALAADLHARHALLLSARQCTQLWQSRHSVRQQPALCDLHGTLSAHERHSVLQQQRQLALQTANVRE